MMPRPRPETMKKKGTSNLKIREKIEKYLNRTLEDDRDIIPHGFIDFWAKNYGKSVDFTLKDKKGNVWKVDKILHLMNKNEIQSGKPSWRGFDGPEELDYSVLYLESMMSNWEDH